MRTRIGPIESLDLFSPSSGAPLLLALDAIDEDPSQPRVEYEPTALQELAETIKLRGVRQPVSVRPHPDEPGRWLLNFGSRRLRASRLAGVEQIPAFVDGTTDSYDQVIENEQREGLRPLELALFVQRRLDAGESRAEIARRLGKDRSYVTRACALIGAPGWLMALYREGRCTGVLELYELRRLHEDHGEQVGRWASALSYIGRADLERLKERFVAAADGRVGPNGNERVAPCNITGELDRFPTGAAVSGGSVVAPCNSTDGADRGQSFGSFGDNRVARCHSGGDLGPQSADGPGPNNGNHVSGPPNGATHSQSVGQQASRANDRLGPISSLEDARRAASSALLVLTQAMAMMEMSPHGGAEALKDLKARLMELSCAGPA